MVPGSTTTLSTKCGRCGKHTSGQPIGKSSVETVNALLDVAEFSKICKTCFSELEALAKRADAMSVDQPGDKLVEGVHYYMENDLVVFTELYHIAKGYCCKSGCRHCAYGYKPEI